ncbi:two-component system, NtrC family, nitrogen regulation sensor histidine kinase GlnL [Marinospirillum celere]|uniref:Sensory histidine kinase/phosphatase NtrB n=1 Tax=Marinospirillum celere TaxID=1122252 RepID=A0A1I1JM67_9GAMM|nr:nitrogen regulation protein NR(II) [Marinospirillum celere]SFC49677.1 two-component system, NtrC family, nitrogen regulation sensor histidine kinase GlnL [Marinospirillum celere]
MNTAPELPRHLLENLTTAVMLLEQNLRLVYMNPAAEMLLAASLTRFRQQPVSLLFQEPDSGLDTLNQAATSGHPYTKREALLQLHNGENITVDYTISPIAELSNTQLIMEVFPRDRQLRISREEELVNKQETVRALVRGMAHEIKNPLGGIRGAAQLLERALPNEDLKDYTQVIIDEADRLRNLVDRMLGPNHLPSMEMLNIHEVLERVYTLAQAEFGDQIRLLRDYDPSLPEFLGDKEQLIQAVLNVVRNSMQALIESGQSNGRITLQSRAKRQFTLGAERHRLVCQVKVIDNGPGIPETMLENIFYPMVSGRAEGTGLGLTIAQAALQKHQGLIECKSRPGHTEFILLLPLDPCNSLDEPSDTGVTP